MVVPVTHPSTQPALTLIIIDLPAGSDRQRVVPAGIQDYDSGGAAGGGYKVHYFRGVQRPGLLPGGLLQLREMPISAVADDQGGFVLGKNRQTEY